MTSSTRLTTEDKALKINLTADIYGCFAEIGAGQEVAANFFKAGGDVTPNLFSPTDFASAIAAAIVSACWRSGCSAGRMSTSTVSNVSLYLLLPNIRAVAKQPINIKTAPKLLLLVRPTGTVLSGFGEYGLMLDIFRFFKDEKIPTI